jgi:hypothetical protein
MPHQKINNLLKISLEEGLLETIKAVRKKIKNKM